MLIVRRISSSVFIRANDYPDYDELIGNKEHAELKKIYELCKIMGVRKPHGDAIYVRIEKSDYDNVKSRIYGKIYKRYVKMDERKIPDDIKPALLEAFQWQHSYKQVARKKLVEYRLQSLERERECIKIAMAELSDIIRSLSKQENEFTQLLKSYRIVSADDEPYAPDYPTTLEQVKNESDVEFWSGR